ncbi:hypothetical protein NFI96_029417 [Prochilodus magdalenae]|nr:hypothetical protein NFI96_029417 [Prochilodus magdalenae]
MAALVFQALVYMALVFQALVYMALVFQALVYMALALVYMALVFQALVCMTPVFQALVCMTPVFQALVCMTPVFQALVYMTPVFQALVYMTPVFQALVCISSLLKSPIHLWPYLSPIASFARQPPNCRSCTDVLCCVLFIIVIFGYVALGAVATTADIQRAVVSSMIHVSGSTIGRRLHHKSIRPGVTPPPPLPHHLQDLCEDTQAAWDGLSQDTIRNLYSSKLRAWIHGDPRKVIHPTDSSGQFCGQKGTPNAKKTILFYFNILKCASPAVLINLQCPTTQRIRESGSPDNHQEELVVHQHCPTSVRTSTVGRPFNHMGLKGCVAVQDVPPWTSEIEVDWTSEIEVDWTSEIEVDWTSKIEVDWTSEIEVDWTSETEVDWTSEIEVDWISEIEVDWTSEIEVDWTSEIEMCVSSCPDRFATYTDMQIQYRFNKSHWEYYRQFCKPGFNNPKKPVAQVLRDEDCPSMIVPSRPFRCSLMDCGFESDVLQRCFPDFITRNGTLTVANKTAFKDALDTARSVTELRDAANGITGILDAKQLGMKIVEDYANSWYWIVIGLIIALVVSLIFILLLRFTAGFLLWFIIFAVIVLVAYVSE